MNEQAQQVLADMLERAMSGVDAAVEFSQAQIPDVVEQLLIWHMVESLVFFTLGILSACAIPYLAKLTIKSAKHEMKSSACYDFFGTAMVGGILWPCYLAWCLVLMLTNLDWLKIWIAPKLYLLEYAASLVK